LWSGTGIILKNDVLLNGYSEGKILHKSDLIAGFPEDTIGGGFLSV